MLEAAVTGAKLSKEAFAQLEPGLRVELLDAQGTLRERAERAVLVILAGDDRVGCDQIFDRLHEWLDARRLVGRTFDDPTQDELERPVAYRFWKELPPRGAIGLFFGAWPAAALLDRCRERIDEREFERRIEHARRLERTLTEDGTVLLKLWVHLPRKAHAKRLKRARRDPREEFLVEELDREILARFDQSMPEVERYLAATHAPHAPWLVIDGSDDERRDLCVGQALLASLRSDGPLPPRPVELAPLAPGPGRLGALDLSPRLEQPEYERRLGALQARLALLSRQARRRGVSGVFVFEGWDAAGKGGAIRRMTRALAARDVRVIPISAPTPEELARHYLWRFWRELPRAGRTVIFDRSWYGRVLVERVEGLARADEWGRAFEELLDFEQQLLERGTLLTKVWLHIDAEEQLRRFEARAQVPHKHYKLTGEDYRNRERWSAYAAAADEMLARTDTPASPWTVVAANDKRWARVRVLETAVAAFERGLAT